MMNGGQIPSYMYENVVHNLKIHDIYLKNRTWIYFCGIISCYFPKPFL